MLDTIKKELVFLNHHKLEIEENKNFTYSVLEPKIEKIDLAPGIHTTTCLNCNRTCHENCIFSNNEDKAKCIAMNKSFCTICPKKCWWFMHVNYPFIYKETT